MQHSRAPALQLPSFARNCFGERLAVYDPVEFKHRITAQHEAVGALAGDRLGFEPRQQQNGVRCGESSCRTHRGILVYERRQHDGLNSC